MDDFDTSGDGNVADRDSKEEEEDDEEEEEHDDDDMVLPIYYLVVNMCNFMFVGVSQK